MCIYLDSGHGGEDRGATAGGLFDEASYNLAMSLELGRKLRNSGYQVQFSRTDDVDMSLAERAVKAKALGAKLVISSHVNAHPSPTLRGLLVFVRRGDWIAYEVAQAIMRAAPPEMRIDGQAIWMTHDDLTLKKKWLQPPHNVLSPYDMPAALVEWTYCTNPGDREALLHAPTRDSLILSGECGVARWRQLTELSSQPIEGYAL